jgi:GH18 family chitinase
MLMRSRSLFSAFLSRCWNPWRATMSSSRHLTNRHATDGASSRFRTSGVRRSSRRRAEALRAEHLEARTLLAAAPVAVDDSVQAATGQSVTFSPLANDSDPDGDTLDIISIDGVENGTVSDSGNVLTFTPAAGFSGVETFSYTVSDPGGLTDSATVSVTVEPGDDADSSGLPGFQYATTIDWGTGFNGEITLTNNGDTTWNGWNIEFDWEHRLTQVWNGKLAQVSGEHHVIRHASWNRRVAPGASVTFGFGGRPGNVTTEPRNLVINGIAIGSGDPPPVNPIASLNDVSVLEGNDGASTATFTVVLDTAPAGAVTIDYVTSDGTATAGADYATQSGTLSFAAGETSKTISIDVFGDTEDESDETFSVTLSNASGATIGDASGQATIFDDDDPPPPPVVPAISISDATVTEGDSGFAAATFTVSLSEVTTVAVSASYSTRDGSAVAGSDYSGASGSVSFAPGELTQTLTINVTGDTLDEATENFFVDLAGLAGAIAGDLTGAGTINDDDNPLPPPDPDPSGKRLVGYFPSWGIYGRDFQVSDVAASQLTHINYAFANVGSDLRIANGDAYADSINFPALQQLKQQHPHLQTMISIGGWTWSERFSDVALTAASRQTFAQSAVQFMLNNGFDGIDIDWEYPVSGGEWDNVSRPADKQNYTLLMQELRSQLDVLEAQHGRDYWLSIASAAGPSHLVNYELANLAATLDWINVMSYDLAGDWDPVTGHNAALYDQPGNPADNRLNWNSVVDAYLGAGVPAGQLVVGAPFYGRVFGGVGSTNNGLYQPDSTIISGTDGESGYLAYWDIQARYLNAGSGYTRYWDDVAQVPYLYNPSTQQFVSYDDPQSIALKADYINARDLGGMMFWELSTDALDHELLTTAFNRLNGSVNPPPPPQPTELSASVSNATVSEGNSGTTTLTFTVSLNRAVLSGETFSVSFATADGTATSGTGSSADDYSTASGVLVFAAGESSRQVAVTVLGDALEEVNETLFLNLANATGGTIADAQGVGTIEDDDAPLAAVVTHRVTSDWGSGHVAEMTITNNTDAPLTDWRLEFDLDGEITGIWSSLIESRVGNHYVLKPASWTSTIAVGGTVTFGFQINGAVTLPTNVKLNGVAISLS